MYDPTWRPIRLTFASASTPPALPLRLGMLARVWLGAACACPVAWAQPSAGVPAGGSTQIQSLDSFQAGQARLSAMLKSQPSAYIDRVMDPSTLPALPDPDGRLGGGDAADAGSSALSLETRYATSSTEAPLSLRKATELGQRLDYRRETLNHGDIGIQIDARQSRGDELNLGAYGLPERRSSQRITLRNIAFPVTPSLSADTALGDIASDVTDALARSYRLSLGNGMVRGLGTRLYDGESDVRAGFGERGILAGGPYPGFEPTRGSLAWLGYSRRLGERAFAGLQVNQARNIDAYPTSAVYGYGAAAAGVADRVTSLAASLGYGSEVYADGEGRARLTWLGSDTQSATGSLAGHAQGLYLEGGFRAAGLRHEVGTYAAGPNLRFGDYAPPSDNRGAYWRVDGSSLRMNWGLGLDLERQNPTGDSARPATRRSSLNANGQYRLGRDDAVGANLSLGLTRDLAPQDAGLAGTGNRSLHASAYYQTRFGNAGRTRLRATVRRSEVLVARDISATGEEVEWEQDWIRGRYETLRPEFTTTLGIARDRSSGTADTSPTAGAVFRLWPDADWSIGGSLRYTARRGNLATSRGLAGTLDTQKLLAGGWALGASLNLNQAVVDVAASSVGQAQLTRSTDKSLAVYLRWEGSRGTGYAGLGLRNPGSTGAGSLDGSVFFDADRDGEQQPGEAGVPLVEVILDGRYRTTTDRNGRFDFPRVATGGHRLTVTAESVPLPWGPAPDRQVAVDVPLRGQATARIPVVRVGD